jgi:hypothetical protein
VKLLEDQPQNVLSYAGNYFHSTNFREGWEKFLKELQEQQSQE